MKKAKKSSKGKRARTRKNWKATFIYLLICVLLVFAINYVWLPAFSLQSTDLWLFLNTFFLLTFLISLMFGKNAVLFGIHAGTVSLLMFIVGLVYFIFGQIISSEMIRANDYHNLVKIQEKDFRSEFDDILKKPSDFFTLDLDTSIRLGNQIIGNISNPEWYSVDPEFKLIIFRGQKYRLSPLVYNGLFNYIKAMNNGIPGYVLIDARTQKAFFVKVTNPIRYSPSAYGSNNLERHLRFQYPTHIFEKSFLEINDEGIPYYVTGVLKPQIGLFGGTIVSSIILTNASTGESKEYKLETVPSWVDHVFTLDYLEKMAFWYYEYVEGYWNSVFSKTNVIRTSYFYRDQEKKNTGITNFYGYNSFALKSGDIAFISSITPANASEVNKGFISMNCRTGEIVYYAAPGSEESRVQQSAQALYQNYGYIATYPTVVNVNGIPTYFLALKNNVGLTQRYAFVRVSDYNVVGAGESIEEALGNYSVKIGGKVDKTLEKATADTSNEGIKLKFKIKKKYSQMVDGTTYYYYVHNGKIYRASSKINELQVTYQVGDEVTITYVDGPSGYAIIRSILK